MYSKCLDQIFMRYHSSDGILGLDYCFKQEAYLRGHCKAKMDRSQMTSATGKKLEDLWGKRIAQSNRLKKFLANLKRIQALANDIRKQVTHLWTWILGVPPFFKGPWGGLQRLQLAIGCIMDPTAASGYLVWRTLQPTGKLLMPIVLQLPTLSILSTPTAYCSS